MPESMKQSRRIVLEDLAEVLHETLGLRVGDILTRDEDMLVKSHASPVFAARFKIASAAAFSLFPASCITVL